MTDGQWSEPISINCPFENATHEYILEYLPKGRGKNITVFEQEVSAMGDEPKRKDVTITRAFKCPTTGNRFKAKIGVSIPLNMKEDNISVK